MNQILYNFFNAFKQKENGLFQLIIINTAVFMFINVLNIFLYLFFPHSGLDKALLEFFLLPAHVPYLLSKPWTLVTYFFTHEGIFHILMNMLFLYWFGMIFSDLLGSRRLVSLYVLGGLAGGLLYIAAYNVFPVFRAELLNARMLGASGAVYAIVVGAATLAPNYRVHLILIGPVKIAYIATFFVLSSFFYIKGDNPGGNIAHLGGAAMGYLFVRQLQRGNDWGKPVEAILGFFRDLFALNNKPKMKVTYKKNKKNTIQSDSPKAQNYSVTRGPAPTQQEIDEILDKISQSGYSSLTKDEKQKLFNASSGGK